jgi:hypothetical protein
MALPPRLVPQGDRGVVDAVVGILSRTGERMTARELVSVLQLAGRVIDRTALNAVLYRQLGSQSPQLEHDEADHTWALVPTGKRANPPSPARRSDATTSEVDGADESTAERAGAVGSFPDNEPVFMPQVPPVQPTPAEPLQVWTTEQQEVVKLGPGARALVVAAPGTGKTAVACARVAHLIQEHGLQASSVLMLSFTRAAVAEARDRIVAAAKDVSILGAVEITTLDSTAWKLDRGFGEHNRTEKIFKSFEEGIGATLNLVRARNPDMEEFLGRITHLIVDEAQDLVGSRSALVLELIEALPESCGVTIFADPAQAIYGFARDGGDDEPQEEAFIDSIGTRLKSFRRFMLEKLHRTSDPRLTRLFKQARACVVPTGETAARQDGTPLERVREAVTADAAAVDGWVQDWDLTAEHLVLFRKRAEVLQQSSFLSSSAVGARKVHRLRLSGYPQPLQPWLAMLFGGFEGSMLSRVDFDRRWSGPLATDFGPYKEAAWGLLSRYAKSRRSPAIDVNLLRGLLSRDRPPIDFCSPDPGSGGPILGTIHASKGRQANHVIMLLPQRHSELEAKREAAEARVVYVGATRARQSLQVGNGSHVVFEKSTTGRSFGVNRGNLYFEVGLEGDFIPYSPADPQFVPNESRAKANQELLARGLAYASCSATLRKVAGDSSYEYQVSLVSREGAIPLGGLSSSLHRELLAIFKANTRSGLAPKYINHLVVYGVRSMVLSGDSPHLSRLHPSFQRSGFFLAPLVKAFTCTKLGLRSR